MYIYIYIIHNTFIYYIQICVLYNIQYIHRIQIDKLWVRFTGTVFTVTKMSTPWLINSRVHQCRPTARN